eukprot:6493819-Pyramimonas_sp.AAC.1
MTNRGVIAGCGFAVSVIKCFSMGIYDRMYYLWPSIDLSVVIDDSTVQAGGQTKDVVKTVTQAAQFACEQFKQRRMKVSLDK